MKFAMDKIWYYIKTWNFDFLWKNYDTLPKTMELCFTIEKNNVTIENNS